MMRGPEVAGRVDRVPGRAAERHADGEDEERDGQGAEGREAGGGAVGAEREDHEHQHEGADDLGDEVERVLRMAGPVLKTASLRPGSSVSTQCGQ